MSYKSIIDQLFVSPFLPGVAGWRCIPMAQKTAPVAEEVERALRRIGRTIEYARKARGDTAAILADRLGVHRQTVARLETGDTGVAAGLVFQALHVYGLTDRLFDLSKPDLVSQSLAQRAALMPKPKRTSS